MANQMIALQARGPQAPNLSSAIQQYGNMIAMQRQTAAAERQAAQAQQQMAIQAAQEERAVQAARLDQLSKVGAFFRDALSGAGFGNVAGIQAARDEAVRMMPSLENIIPPAQVLATDQNAFTQASMTASQLADKLYGTATTSTQIDPATNQIMGVNVSGMPNRSFAQPVPNISQPRGAAPRAPAAQAPQQTAPAMPAPSGSMEERLRGLGSPLPPAIMRRNGINVRPMAFDPNEAAPQPDMANVVQTMMQTGVVSQSNLDAMRQMAGPDKDAQIVQLLQANNIRIMPDEQPVSGMSSAVYRPEGGAPAMQEVQYDPNDYAPTYGKSPMQSPMPGSAIVPLPRVRGESEAGEAGKQGVRVVTEPKIVAGEERAKRLEKLRGELPIARSETETVVRDLTDKINAVDEFLRNPYRNSIIGPIEGNLPSIAQFGERANAQAQWDYITNNTTLQKLIDDRRSTETGASPQGIISDRDLGVAANAASKLRRTGTPQFNEKELQRIRDIWYATRERARRTFSDTYRDVMEPGFDVNAPGVAPKYRSKAPRRTPTKGPKAAPNTGWGTATVVGE